MLHHLKARIEASGKGVVTVLLSEIFPQKLALMADVGAWVQIACPRFVLFKTLFSQVQRADALKT